MSTKFEIVRMLTILLALSALHKTEGIQCFVCEYWGDNGKEGCQGSPPPSKYLQDCKSGKCRVLHAAENGKIYTERGCAGDVGGDIGCTETHFKDHLYGTPWRFGTNCYCDDRDGCNNGWKLGPTRIALFLTPIAFWV